MVTSYSSHSIIWPKNTCKHKSKEKPTQEPSKLLQVSAKKIYFQPGDTRREFEQLSQWGQDAIPISRDLDRSEELYFRHISSEPTKVTRKVDSTILPALDSGYDPADLRPHWCMLEYAQHAPQQLRMMEGSNYPSIMFLFNKTNQHNFLWIYRPNNDLTKEWNV